jgi:hypothetical protein
MACMLNFISSAPNVINYRTQSKSTQQAFKSVAPSLHIQTFMEWTFHIFVVVAKVQILHTICSYPNILINLEGDVNMRKNDSG